MTTQAQVMCAGTVAQVDAEVKTHSCGEDRVAVALLRMRECAARAHGDAHTLTGELRRQAEVRRELFAQSAADLAGTTVGEELARAANEQGEPGWSL